MDKKIKIKSDVTVTKIPITYIGENFEDESRKHEVKLKLIRTKNAN